MGSIDGWTHRKYPRLPLILHSMTLLDLTFLSESYKQSKTFAVILRTKDNLCPKYEPLISKMFELKAINVGRS